MGQSSSRNPSVWCSLLEIHVVSKNSSRKKEQTHKALVLQVLKGVLVWVWFIFSIRRRDKKTYE